MATRTLKQFEAVGLSPAHVGKIASDRAAALILDPLYTPCVPVLTVAAEDADEIAVSIALKDADGKPLEVSRRLLVKVYDEAFEPAVAAAHTIAAGVGTEISPTASAALLISTTSGGLAEVTVTDVVGGLDDTIWLEVTPVDGLGAPAVIGLTFDAA